MRLLIFMLAAILLMFQYDFWFGKNGYIDCLETNREIAIRKQENDKLINRNQEVNAEIKDLKEGVAAIEERARLEHEMIKDDETFYRIGKEYK
ncbi:cell division protein FtsB [Seminibacterium arietis]|uniref:Cell division protein FtsB n=1 Tax=Seminibacterium arietis TaxID=1173502 RepID=A0ABW3IAW2_9PAST